MLENDNPKGEGEFSSLNPEDGRDRQVMERAIRERWPISTKHRKSITAKLELIASGSDPKFDTRAITSAARTLARMDALNQADEHKDRAYARIDDGKATESVNYQCPPIHQLPLPPHLIAKPLPPAREG